MLDISVEVSLISAARDRHGTSGPRPSNPLYIMAITSKTDEFE